MKRGIIIDKETKEILRFFDDAKNRGRDRTEKEIEKGIWIPSEDIEVISENKLNRNIDNIEMGETLKSDGSLEQRAISKKFRYLFGKKFKVANKDINDSKVFEFPKELSQSELNGLKKNVSGSFQKREILEFTDMRKAQSKYLREPAEKAFEERKKRESKEQ